MLAENAACPRELQALSSQHKQCALNTEVRTVWFPERYFYWPLTEKWYCKSKIATDVKANIGNVPAEAPS